MRSQHEQTVSRHPWIDTCIEKEKAAPVPMELGPKRAGSLLFDDALLVPGSAGMPNRNTKH